MNKSNTPKRAAKSGRAATSSAKTADVPADGFSYSRTFFEGLVDTALAHAKKLGATDARRTRPRAAA